MTRPRIGIVGAGQLGRMLALAGYPLGLRFTFLDPNPDACAAQVGDCIQGAYDDPAKLRELADTVDIVTFEFENVPVATLETVAALKPFFPPVAALATGQDRLTEKTLFSELGIPTPKFRAVDSQADLEQAVSEIGLPGILKTRRLGYDGRGQYRLQQTADIGPAWDALGGTPLIYEGFVPFMREVSVIGARGRDGKVAIYPLSENTHRNGILHMARAPYRHPALQKQAEAHLKKLFKHLNYVGVLTVEFFVLNGKLIANEMAPRVHNSGHASIEGSHTSQFENHLRAICGLPLGSTAPRGFSGMVNFVGTIPTAAATLKLENVHFHHYGKAPRPARKLGHATVIAATAVERDRALKKLLRIAK